MDDRAALLADSSRNRTPAQGSISQPVDNETSGIDPDDPARSALADARKVSRTAPARTGDPGSGRGRSSSARRRTRAQDVLGRNRGGYSAAHADPERDPHRLGPLLTGWIDELGWERPIAEGRLFADWSSLVGPDIAAHCVPQSLHDGELRITAESTAWASQLRLLSSALLARLVAELGPQIVTTLSVTGPSGPSWKHGAWSVRGSRGPRDTYG